MNAKEFLKNKDYDKAVNFLLEYTASSKWEDINKLNWTTSEVADVMQKHAASRSEWVSVEERLPEHMQDVVLYSQNGSVIKGYCFKGSLYSWDDVLLKTVTHWQLPPKAK